MRKVLIPFLDSKKKLIILPLLSWLCQSPCSSLSSSPSFPLSVCLSGPPLALQRALSERKIHNRPSLWTFVCVVLQVCVWVLVVWNTHRNCCFGSCENCYTNAKQTSSLKKASESYIYAYGLKLPLNRLTKVDRDPTDPLDWRCVWRSTCCDHRCLSVGRDHHQPWVQGVVDTASWHLRISSDIKQPFRTSRGDSCRLLTHWRKIESTRINVRNLACSQVFLEFGLVITWPQVMSRSRLDVRRMCNRKSQISVLHTMCGNIDTCRYYICRSRAGVVISESILWLGW